MRLQVGQRLLQPRPVGLPLVRLLCLILVLNSCGLLAFPVSALADKEASLTLGEPYLKRNHLYLDLEMANLISTDIEEALHSGLPATLVVEWRIWRNISSWWDEEVGTDATFFRVYYDVLSQRYDVFNSRGRAVASAHNLQDIETAICSKRGLRLAPGEVLKPEAIYSIEVMVRLEPLDDQEIKNLGDWLSGNTPENKSFLSSISNSAVGWLKGLVGPGERRAYARTLPFSFSAEKFAKRQSDEGR